MPQFIAGASFVFTAPLFFVRLIIERPLLHEVPFPEFGGFPMTTFNDPNVVDITSRILSKHKQDKIADELATQDAIDRFMADMKDYIKKPKTLYDMIESHTPILLHQREPIICIPLAAINHSIAPEVVSLLEIMPGLTAVKHFINNSVPEFISLNKKIRISAEAKFFASSQIARSMGGHVDIHSDLHNLHIYCALISLE